MGTTCTAFPDRYIPYVSHRDRSDSSRHIVGKAQVEEMQCIPLTVARLGKALKTRPERLREVVHLDMDHFFGDEEYILEEIAPILPRLQSISLSGPMPMTEDPTTKFIFILQTVTLLPRLTSFYYSSHSDLHDELHRFARLFTTLKYLTLDLTESHSKISGGRISYHRNQHVHTPCGCCESGMTSAAEGCHADFDIDLPLLLELTIVEMYGKKECTILYCVDIIKHARGITTLNLLRGPPRIETYVGRKMWDVICDLPDLKRLAWERLTTDVTFQGEGEDLRGSVQNMKGLKVVDLIGIGDLYCKQIYDESFTTMVVRSCEDEKSEMS